MKMISARQVLLRVAAKSGDGLPCVMSTVATRRGMIIDVILHNFRCRSTQVSVTKRTGLLTKTPLPHSNYTDGHNTYM